MTESEARPSASQVHGFGSRRTRALAAPLTARASGATPVVLPLLFGPDPGGLGRAPSAAGHPRSGQHLLPLVPLNPMPDAHKPNTMLLGSG